MHDRAPYQPSRRFSRRLVASQHPTVWQCQLEYRRGIQRGLAHGECDLLYTIIEPVVKIKSVPPT
jgi:hypothetical protein